MIHKMSSRLRQHDPSLGDVLDGACGGTLTLISTCRVLRLKRTCSCRFSTIGVKIFSQFSFSGV
ncbi:hypothetical protein EYF80_008607 [Liparis tanakae]|uniref:Uncharacterized protein n=1 Tax=Liparis tanakae TaxID=230148 RepID=A0A4Z2ISZ2_9TELE|nr:hypothetical protein EYF80_008607 [Liparis tanakae]